MHKRGFSWLGLFILVCGLASSGCREAAIEGFTDGVRGGTASVIVTLIERELDRRQNDE